MITYVVVVWLHVLAAAVWIGSMVFFAVVVVPSLRRGELRSVAPRFLRLAGARFRALGWIAMGVLIVTGVLNLHLRGVLGQALAPSFWSSGFGRVLAWKVAFVALALILSLTHESVAGARAVSILERDPDSDAARRIRKTASMLGRLVMLVSLVILFLAVALVRGAFG